MQYGWLLVKLMAFQGTALETLLSDLTQVRIDRRD